MEDEDRKGHVLALEKSYRLRLPQPLCQKVGWITGAEVSAWLLLYTSERCRLLSRSEIDDDPDLKELHSKATGKATHHESGSLEFQDAASVVLRLRLQEIELNRHETSGWRFTLPRTMAAIMQLCPEESSLVALIVQDHVELWTISAMRSAANTPFSEIL